MFIKEGYACMLVWTIAIFRTHKMGGSIIIGALLLQAALLSSQTKTPLYFSYITSINPKVGFSAGGGIPILNIALEMINSNSYVLENYTLGYTEVLDSKCEQTASLDAFFKHFTEDNHTYIATACCGCSVATIPVAEISHYWNVPQISHVTALSLNDRSRFRSFFRILPTNKNLHFGILRVMKEFKWRKMLVITQNEDLFTGLAQVLQKLFTINNWIIDILLIDTNLNPVDLIFEKIEKEHYKINFINTYSQLSYKIFCGAFHRGLIAPKYIWITHLWYNREWWKYLADEDTSCSPENIATALDGSIGMIPNGFVPKETSKESFSGINFEEFLSLYTEQIEGFQLNNMSVSPIGLPNVVFDMIWTLALGLDIAVERVARRNDSGCENIEGDIVPLENFTYSNKKMGCILKGSMGSVQFEGLSGEIMFNENGSQPDNILLVQQYRNQGNNVIERVSVATVDVTTDQFTYTNKNLTSLWTELPYDGYPQRIVDQYHIALLSVYGVLIVCGLVFAAVCFIFNTVFRKKKVLKLSSSNLNYLVILGSVILYLTVFIFMYMPSKVDQVIAASVICNLRIWLFSLGYTICFAVILSKTWRVYHIFNNPSPNKKVIKDWLLLVMIGVIVLVDLLILVVGTTIDGSRLKANEIKNVENPIQENEESKVTESYIYVCLRNRSGPIIWLSISYAYKGLLQIIGIFMAFHIRKVKLKAMNDSKAITAIIYVNTIILITLAASTFALDDYHNRHAAIIGLVLLIDASLFLGALFIPKMAALYKDPNESNIFKKENDTSSHNTLKTRQAMDHDKQLIMKLQEEIVNLKSTLQKANIN